LKGGSWRSQEKVFVSGGCSDWLALMLKVIVDVVCMKLCTDFGFLALGTHMILTVHDPFANMVGCASMVERSIYEW